jgi:hypothetical protein
LQVTTREVNEWKCALCRTKRVKLGKGGEGSVGKKGKGMGEERKGYILGAAIVVVRLVGLVVVPGEAQKRLARLAVFHETKGGGNQRRWDDDMRELGGVKETGRLSVISVSFPCFCEADQSSRGRPAEKHRRVTSIGWSGTTMFRFFPGRPAVGKPPIDHPGLVMEHGPSSTGQG